MLFDVGRNPVKEASVLDGRGVKGVEVSVEVSRHVFEASLKQGNQGFQGELRPSLSEGEDKVQQALTLLAIGLKGCRMIQACCLISEL